MRCSLPARSEPRCICFGKLPITGDFLRGDGPVPEFDELDHWIQHGMYDSQQRIRDGWQERFDALPRSKFLWTNGQGVVIAGWWQASRDSVGRRYPFLLAVRLADVRPEDYAALPFALADYFADAKTLLDTEFTGKDVVTAIESAQSLTCELNWEEAHRDLRAAQAAANAQDAWSGHQDAPELLLHDLQQVASQHHAPQYSLRWPTRGADSDIAFWLAAMAQFGQAMPRMLMWHESLADGTESGSARVTLCALQPRLFAGMTFFDRDDDDAYDMGRGVDDDQRMQEARSRFAATVRADNQAAAISILPTESR